MSAKVDFILKTTRNEGLHFRVYTKARDPWEQARLWRQSRSHEEIQRAILKLRQEGALFLADILASVGPQYGRWATNNLPGQSWHQYGEAIDVVLVSTAEKTVWNGSNPAYERLAKIAVKVGLHSGFYWKSRDANHLQLRPDAARAYYSWAELSRLSQLKYESWDGRPNTENRQEPGS